MNDRQLVDMQYSIIQGKSENVRITYISKNSFKNIKENFINRE